MPDALAHISGKYTRLFAYDTTDVDDPWEVYDIDVPAYVNDLQELTAGRGLWLKAIEGGTPPRGAPPITSLAGRSQNVTVSDDGPIVVIGERINPSGRKDLTRAIEKR